MNLNQLFPIMHPGDLLTNKQATGVPRIYLVLSEGELKLFGRSKYDSSHLNPKPAEIPIYSYLVLDLTYQHKHRAELSPRSNWAVFARLHDD